MRKMKKEQVKNEDFSKIEFNFFEDYNNKVEVVGFKNSWISEFNQDMKNAYESKKETRATTKNTTSNTV